MTNSNKPDKKILVRYNDAHLSEDLKLLASFTRGKTNPAFIAGVKIAAALLRSHGYKENMTYEAEEEVYKKIHGLIEYATGKGKIYSMFWEA
jgi:hypothetical protein